MTLKARYEPDVDRMRIVLQQEDGASKVYWAMRRQWLGLLFQLRKTAGQLQVELATPEAPKAPRGRPPKDPATDALEAIMLDGFRVRIVGDNVRLLLVADKKARGFSVKASGLRRLEEMVALQAERAGWDPQPAMRRLQAEIDARAALSKASK